MNKLILTTLTVALGVTSSLAMPTKADLKKAQPLVNELMTPSLSAFKAAKGEAKTAAAETVADASRNFAKEAETEAAKFLLLKGAVTYYVRAEKYDKAADAVKTLQSEIKNVPPSVIAEITGKATSRISESKAPALYSLYRTAKLKSKAAEDVKTLAAKLKKIQSDALQRKYAEALALSGDWKAAYAAFAKVKNADLQKIASDKATNAESGEFWWTYEPATVDAKDFFKSHAIAYYRKALNAGEITGLKKNLIEQRIGDDERLHQTFDTTKLAPSDVKWNYEVKNGEIILGGNGRPAVPTDTKGTLIIPKFIGGMKVASIGEHAFKDCKQITSVSIPSSVKCIRNGAFYSCCELASLRIPAGVTDVDASAFTAMNSINSFDVDSTNPAFAAKNGLLCTKDGSRLVAGINGNVRIPDGIVTIGAQSFLSRAKETTVTIPASVTKIEDRAFGYFVGLKSVTMLGERPDAQKNIFVGCGNLQAIHVSAKAKSWAGMTEWLGKPLVFDAK